ncbi:tyrosine-type recombinase/integrase [Nitrososphaera sp.]|uniref:tyrosine-type recombinase/integrase n=1 Tax=Nitrososphaera sp. TaxID=1971748 RepID=UPI0017CD82DF|nr:tyrosine-type recombinase/integrase [Nitrososphaera sp.]NWG36105.1 tyrosine-type recombinase/integrase [Nitrososphaera sp.]
MTAVELKPAVDIAKLMQEFVEDCKVRHLTDETIGRYKSPLKLFFKFVAEKDKSVYEVDKFVLKDFIQYRRGQDIDQKTIENNFTALSTFYEFLCFEGYTYANPVLPVRKRYLKRYKDDDDGGDNFDESARKLATVEQMAMLVNSILSVRDQAVVLTLAKTGLRRSELASIDIEDDNGGTGNVNWVEQSITLTRKKFKKRSGRTVFVDGETARVLKRWDAQRKKLYPKTKALFVNEYGERLGRNGIYNLVTKYAHAVGLHEPKSDRIEDHFSAHNCRHWFTTWLRRNGMPREFIKALRGDKRKDAIDIYDHIDREELRKAYLAFIPQLGLE